MAKKKDETEIELNERQKKFCQEYIFDFNGTRAYKSAYAESIESDDAARANASRLLTNANIQAYIKFLQSDLETTSGISRLRVLREHEKLAFNSIAHLHETWITRKAFDALTDDQKAGIAEISTQTRKEEDYKGDVVVIDYVKIKLYDKQKALDSISKMLGFDAPDKVEHNINGLKTFVIEPASAGKKAN